MISLYLLSPTSSTPLRPPRSHQQEQEKVCSPTLKKQITDQGFAGAVAVIAILHRPSRPAAIVPADTAPNSAKVATTSKPILQATQVFLHVANVGDCRAVLCRAGKAIALTHDHTPAVASEATRVEAAGGFVSRGRVNGILGVSRSFGDVHCKV